MPQPTLLLLRWNASNGLDQARLDAISDVEAARGNIDDALAQTIAARDTSLDIKQDVAAIEASVEATRGNIDDALAQTVEARDASLDIRQDVAAIKDVVESILAGGIYTTFSAAQADILNINDNEIIRIVSDEENGGQSSLYQKNGSSLDFLQIIDQNFISNLPSRWDAPSIIADIIAPMADGAIVRIEGFDYVVEAGATDILDLPGLAPFGRPAPQHWGSLGRLKVFIPTEPFRLSDRFATLAEAQAVYPKAVSLTQTIDDVAVQRAIDHLRGIVLFAIDAGGGFTNPTLSVDISLVWPDGTYYISTDIDMTNINAGHTFWSIHFQGPTIYVAGSCTTGFDLMGSRKFAPIGFANGVGLWTADGVPRSFMQTGRVTAPVPADCHTFANMAWDIKGRFSLATIHNYASEDFRLGNTALKNSLDHRVNHITFDGSDGLTFAANEIVTWGASSGRAVYVRNDTTTGEVAIRVESGPAPVDNDVLTGATSGKVATVNGTPIAEPMGEGPDGRSYCMVQDGDNYWGITSEYVANPAVNVPASFLKNEGTVDFRHLGRGDAMWFSFPLDHNYLDSYIVSQDSDDGAAVTAMANTSSRVLTGCRFDVHIETDAADNDASTGLDFAFRFESSQVNRDVIVSGHSLRMTQVHSQAAVYHQGTNVDSVEFTFDNDITLLGLGRDDGQVLFGNPATVKFHGTLICAENGTAPFLNISSLDSFTGVLECPDVTLSHVRHPTSSYILRDILGASGVWNGVPRVRFFENVLNVTITAGDEFGFTTLDDQVGPFSVSPTVLAGGGSPLVIGKAGTYEIGGNIDFRKGGENSVRVIRRRSGVSDAVITNINLRAVNAGQATKSIPPTLVDLEIDDELVLDTPSGTTISKFQRFTELSVKYVGMT